MTLWIVGYRFFRQLPAVDGVIASEDDVKAAQQAGKQITFKDAERTPGTSLQTNPFPLVTTADIAAYGPIKTQLDQDAADLVNTSEKWKQFGNRKVFINLLNMDTGVLSEFQRTFVSDAELATNHAEAVAAGYF